MGITHFNGLQVAGVPTMGMGGLLPYTGNWWFVDPLNGSDGQQGQASTPFKSLNQAQAAAVAGQNDVVVLSDTSSNYLTASLTWAKNQVHLIGINSGQMNGKRSRIAPSAALAGTAGFNNLVSVTAQNCMFMNLGTFYGFANTAAALVCWSDTGGRNNYVNCEFLGFGDATTTTGSSNLTGSRAFVFNNNVGESTFRGCYFGENTSPRNATNHTLELAGGAPRLFFEDCTFAADLGSSGTASSHVLIDTGGIDREAIFARCRFLSSIKSGGSAMAQVFNTNASPGGAVLLDQCTAFGCTAWETTPSNNIYYNMSIVGAAGAGGISLVL